MSVLTLFIKTQCLIVEFYNMPFSLCPTLSWETHNCKYIFFKIDMLDFQNVKSILKMYTLYVKDSFISQVREPAGW